MRLDALSFDWTVWDGTSFEWNKTISQFDDVNVYQTSEWADHKTASSWNVIRLVCSYDGVRIVTAAQCLFRRGPLQTVIIWVPGGPIGDLSKVTPSFVKILKRHLHANFIYVRLSVMRGVNPDTSTQLSSCHWHKSSLTVGTNSSLVHYLDVEQSARLTRCTSNWKRNLKRSSKNTAPPYVWINPDAASLSLAYSHMNNFKKIDGVLLTRSTSELQSVIDVFGENLILVRSDDPEGNLLAIRGVICFHKTAWDFIAVTTPLGRKSYASHAVFWMLAEECFGRGMKRYDLGGIDPLNNRGVYDFKKGTGSVQVDYQGEWDSSSPRWFRVVASRLISRKVS